MALLGLVVVLAVFTSAAGAASWPPPNSNPGSVRVIRDHGHKVVCYRWRMSNRYGWVDWCAERQMPAAHVAKWHNPEPIGSKKRTLAGYFDGSKRRHLSGFWDG